MAKKKKPGKQPKKKAGSGKKRALPFKIAKTKDGFIYRPWYRKPAEETIKKGGSPWMVNTVSDAERLAKALKIDPDLAMAIVDADIKFYDARNKERRPKWMSKKDLMKLVARVRWREKVSERFALTPIMANILLNFDVERFILLCVQPVADPVRTN